MSIGNVRGLRKCRDGMWNMHERVWVVPMFEGVSRGNGRRANNQRIAKASE